MRISDYRCIAAAGIGVALFLSLFCGLLMAGRLPGSLSGQIEQRLEGADENAPMFCGDSVIYAAAALLDLYPDRRFEPAWIGDEGPLPHVGPFLQRIAGADRDGLNPEDYHLDHIRVLLKQWQTSREGGEAFPLSRRIDLELLLTDAFVLFGHHLLNGRVDPEKLHPDWLAYRKDESLLDVVGEALASGRIEDALRRLTPRDPLYAGLKKTLAVYRQAAERGGWPVLYDPRTAKGRRDAGRHPALLRQRLEMSGDLIRSGDTHPRGYDESLRQAVRRFQKRNGLKADGIVSGTTLRELNVPVEKRIEGVVLNMERLRWLPEEVNRRYIVVNIADFNLEVLDAGRIVMSMPIVVGKQNQRTSVFSGKMTFIELNPYWNIPQSIAVKEILPQVKKDLAYLARKRIKVIEYWKRQEREVDPAKVNWARLNQDNLKYNFRQDAGPGNALGRVKFIFPNKFEIYLHDTPERHLFQRSRRTFSHGCIRIARPVELAEYLLKDDLNWDRRKILSEIGKGKRQVLYLKEPVEVHILYLTAWTDHRGEAQFRPDIYDGDGPLLRALQEKPRVLTREDVEPHPEAEDAP